MSATAPAVRSHVVVPHIGLVFPGSCRSMPGWVQARSSRRWRSRRRGAWLIYGRAAYGGRYRDAIKRTRRDYQILRNYAWVAGRFELSRRRDTLSFGHNAEVAALPDPEQDFWLRKAAEPGWSIMRLRRQARASLAERGQQPTSPGAGHGPGNAPPGQLELCERAADQDAMPVHAWAALALERAAALGVLGVRV